jgi:hypothetical protein
MRIVSKEANANLPQFFSMRFEFFEVSSIDFDIVHSSNLHYVDLRVLSIFRFLMEQEKIGFE